MGKSVRKSGGEWSCGEKAIDIPRVRLKWRNDQKSKLSDLYMNSAVERNNSVDFSILK